jgi:hypothetical protein
MRTTIVVTFHVSPVGQFRAIFRMHALETKYQDSNGLASFCDMIMVAGAVIRLTSFAVR